MAKNIEHMHLEETVLHAIHARLLASVPPAELMLMLGRMLPAPTLARRADMLGAMQTQPPPEVMRAPPRANMTCVTSP